MSAAKKRRLILLAVVRYCHLGMAPVANPAASKRQRGWERREHRESAAAGSRKGEFKYTL